MKCLWSNFYFVPGVVLAVQQSEYYARGCSIRYLLYVQQSAMVLYDRNSQYWGKYLCFRLSFFLTFFPITCDNVFSFPMLFFGRKKYWSFFKKKQTDSKEYFSEDCLSCFNLLRTWLASIISSQTTRSLGLSVFNWNVLKMESALFEM